MKSFMSRIMEKPELFPTENSNELIFNWIINDSRDPTKLNDLQRFRQRLLKSFRLDMDMLGLLGDLAKFIKKCDHIFKDDSFLPPTSEKEQDQYRYDKGSHEWIATGLGVFAACVMVRQMSEGRFWLTINLTLNDLYPEIVQFLDLFPLEVQAKKCKIFLESVASANDSNKGNPHGISGEHWQAYCTVFTGICEACFDDRQTEQFIPECDGEWIANCRKEQGYQACLWFLKGFIISITTDNFRDSMECYQIAELQEPSYYFWQFINGAFESYPETVQIQTGISLIIAGLEAKMKGQVYWNDSNWKLLELLRNTFTCLSTTNPSTLHRKWAAIKIGEVYIQNCKAKEPDEKDVCREEIGKELLEMCLFEFPNCHLTLAALAMLDENASPFGTFIDLENSSTFKTKMTQLCKKTYTTKSIQLHISDMDRITGNRANCFNETQAETAVTRIYKPNTDNAKTAKPSQGQCQEYKEGRFDFNFKLECPSVWISEYIKKLPMYNVKRLKNTRKYLRSRLELRKKEFRELLRKHQETLESEDEGGERIGIGSEGWICEKLCTAALELHLKGNHRLLKTRMKECASVLKTNQFKIPQDHCQVYKYLVDATSLFNDFHSLKSGDPNHVTAKQMKTRDEFYKGYTELQQNCQLVMNSSGVLLCVKGTLAALLGLVPDVSLALYRKAVALEPNYFLWQRMLNDMDKESRNRDKPSQDQSQKSDEKIFDFNFKLECPSVWISEYFEKLPKCTVKKFRTTTAYLQSRRSIREFPFQDLSHKHQEMLESEEAGEKNETWTVGDEWICEKLCIAALELHLNGNQHLLETKMEECASVLETNHFKILEEHCQVYKYLVGATSLFKDFQKLKNDEHSSGKWMKNNNCVTAKKTKKQEKSHQKQMKRQDEFCQRYTELQQSCQSVMSSSSGVIHCVKERLAALLSFVSNVSLDQDGDTLVHERNYFLWQQRLYDMDRESGNRDNCINANYAKVSKTAATNICEGKTDIKMDATQEPSNTKINKPSQGQCKKSKEKGFDVNFKLECPSVWISEYIEKLPTYTVQKFENTTAYLHSRLRKMEYQFQDLSRKHQETLEGEDEEKNEMRTGSEEWICGELCTAALEFHLNGKERRTETNMEECALALETNQFEIPQGHCQVYQYLVDATSLFKDCQKLKNDNRGTEKWMRNRVAVFKEREDFFEKYTALQQNWQLIINSSAVIHYVKGLLAGLMGLLPDVSLDQFRKAVALEPNYLLWQQMLYETLKQSRKTGSNLNAPSREEILACQKAHQLCPENVKYAMDLGTIKLQMLRGIDKQKPCSLAKEAQSVEELFREVINRAPENSWFEMLGKLKTAELYTTHGLPQRTEEAKKIFTECYQRWPKSSMVLHKFGKFYQASHMPAKAQQVYEEALQVSPQNYPCLMDYLKLHGKLLKRYAEMVAQIEMCLPSIKEPEHIVNLLVIKGQAHWLLCDKPAACSAWVEGFVNFEWLASKIEKRLESSSSFIFGKLNISWGEMCRHFKEACKQEKVSGNKAISNFMTKLEMAERISRPRPRFTFSQAKEFLTSGE